jgi:beta-lactamase regulating signal transducer with metallopeptidase domain
MMSPDVHSLATTVAERLLFTLAAGSVLALMVSLLQRLLRPNSQTRFAICFSALIAVAILPVAGFMPAALSLGKFSTTHPLFTISTRWAEYVVAAWAMLALLGVARVAFALWQLRRLRRDAIALDSSRFAPEVCDQVACACGRRKVTLMVSSRVEVPTAVGFLHPAVILPAWMIVGKGDAGGDDLKYILLHELAHLRRWDDWTNLAQKLVKSFLFFHPGVLWIERKLVLDREMACDDAVITETGNPRKYAECLTQIAEKNFLRRQIAMAQAAVSRMHQLSRRVASILDAERSHSTRIWKPAVPVVAGAALLCALSASSTNDLIGFSDSGPSLASGAVTQPELGNHVSMMPAIIPANLKAPGEVRAITANFKYEVQKPALSRKPHRTTAFRRSRERSTDAIAKAFEVQPGIDTQASVQMSRYEVPQGTDEANARGVVLLVVRREVKVDDQVQGVQIRSWELFFYVPPHVKPIPNKT